MVVLKSKLTTFQFHLILNIVFGIFITLSSYIHTPIAGFKDFSLYVGHFLLQQFCAFGCLYLLSLNRIVFKICFPIIFIALSLAAFWAYTLDISFSDGIVQATMETKPDIVLDLISFPLLIFMIIAVFIVILILKLYDKIQTKRFNWFLFILSIIAIVLFFRVEKNRPRTLTNRLPFNIFFEIKNYYSEDNSLSYFLVNNEIISKENNLKIYLIFGESLRADHLSLNDYHRNTTPLLAQQENLISFSNAYTPNTYTAISLPQILSNTSVYDSIQTEKKYSLTNILNQAEITTFWIGNQTPEKSYLNFINECDSTTFIDPLHSVFSFKKKSDLELLPYPSKKQNETGNSLAIFHTIGSHWYYENRYTDEFRKFTPTITSKHIPTNTKEEMINSYDNTIVFTDYFLHQFIEKVKLKNENSIVLFVSGSWRIIRRKRQMVTRFFRNRKRTKKSGSFTLVFGYFQRK